MFNQYAYNQGIYQGVNSPVNSTSVITAICKAQEGLAFPKFLAGGKGGSAGSSYKLFSKAITYTQNLWRSKLYSFDTPFNVTAITLSFSTTLNQNHIITPTLYLDNGGTTVVGTQIDTINYPEGPKEITLYPANFSYNTHGDNNFLLELEFTGTDLIAVTLPITVEIETQEP